MGDGSRRSLVDISKPSDRKTDVPTGAGEVAQEVIRRAPGGTWVALVALGVWWFSSEFAGVRSLAEQAAADAKEARALTQRLDSIEAEQAQLRRALLKATYVQTDHLAWSVETTRWLAANLVPGQEPPRAPDFAQRMRDVQSMIGRP